MAIARLRVLAAGGLLLGAFLTSSQSPASPRPGGGTVLPLASGLTSAPLFTPLGTPCEGLTLDPGTYNDATSSYPAPGTYATRMQRYVPQSLPFRPTAVCAVAGNFGGPTPYEIVFYTDDAGSPGTLIGKIPAVAPAFTSGAALEWKTMDVDGEVPPIQGPFWAGFRDTSPLITVAVSRPGTGTLAVRNGDSGPWWTAPAGNHYDFLLRVVGLSGPAATPSVVPSLSGLGAAVFAAALAACGLLLLGKG